MIVFCIASPLPALGGKAGESLAQPAAREKARRQRDRSAARRRAESPRRADAQKQDKAPGVFAGTFPNADPIAVPDSGNATPYPSDVAVSGLDGSVVSVKVTLTDVQHGYAEDLDVALLGPRGQTALLMSDAGAGAAFYETALTFDDNAVATLPATGPVVSGTYHPTDHIGASGVEPDTFSVPAGPEPYFADLTSAFAGTDPNGTWRLLVTDDKASDSGSIGGWSLEIVTAEPTEFTNADGITIEDMGGAAPYPSTIDVTGLAGKVGRVRVTLVELAHEWASDMDVLLVGPQGQSTVVMSDVDAEELVDAVYTFADEFPTPSNQMPSGGPVPSETYGSTDVDDNFTDSWSAPAPEGPYGKTLQVFNGTDPNGEWKLFITDDDTGYVGTIGRWHLHFTMVPDPPACSPLAVSPSSLPGGTKGEGYAQTLTQTGGTAPIDWSVPSGLLPNGLVLNADTGKISGTPTAEGPFSFDVVAADAYGCTGTQSYSITIAPAPITLSPTSLPAATAGVAYAPVEMTASGGDAPYSYDLSGALPAGMTFEKGVFMGTPTQSGAFTVTVTATDLNGRTGTQELTLTVNCAIVTAGPEIVPSGTNGAPYGPQSFTAMGGVAPYTFSLSAGTLPTGMTFENGVLAGTPTQSGTFPLTVTATDAAGCTDQVSVLLQVCCPAASLSAPGHSAPAAGGAGSVGVTAGAGCEWMAFSNVDWITVTSGPSGTGNGTVEFSVAFNATGAPRTGTLSIAELTFTVTQAGLGGSDTVGVYAPATGTWLLRNSNSGGAADLAFRYGPAGASLTPIGGDWDNDGDDTAGLYNPATGTFFLKNENAAGAADLTFNFGPAGAGLVPVVGDWDKDGFDTIGLYDPASGTFFLKNTNAAGAADLVFRFGAGGPGFLPVAGDWDQDGRDTIGFYSPVTGTYFLKNDNWYGPADLTFRYSSPNRLPLAGDWDADGRGTVGAYAPASGTFFLKNANAAGVADATFTFGPANLKPVAGNWDGQ